MSHRTRRCGLAGHGCCWHPERKPRLEGTRGVVCCWCDAWTTFEIAVNLANKLSDEVLASHTDIHGPHHPAPQAKGKAPKK